MHPLVDSHAHLDLEAFDADRPAVIARAGMAGVRHLVVPATDCESWPRVQKLCDGRPDIHPAYGLHPLFMARHRLEHLDRLGEWLDEHAAVAVGEIGLDYHQEETDRTRQHRFFETQLRLARGLDLPVIVHARQALEEVTLALRRCAGVRGVVHSFSGSEQQAGKLWDLGFHLGIGGPVTYERAQRLRRIVARMPIQFLLLESDAPDQPDAAHRGQRNEPARIIEILRCVAELRGESEQHVAQATTANALRLFGLDRSP
jgi:TatD DNase family protein